MSNLTLSSKPRVSTESERPKVTEINKPFKCTKCDSRFTTNAARNIHSRIHTDNVGQVFKCTQCTYVTTDYTNFRKHRLNFCVQEARKKITVTKIWKCRACDYGCHYKQMMISHFFSTHIGIESRFQCTDCNFETLEISVLENHVQQKHNAPMEYVCGTCKFTCKTQPDMLKHIQELHPDQPTNDEQEIIDIDDDQDAKNDGEKNGNKGDQEVKTYGGKIANKDQAVKTYGGKIANKDQDVKNDGEKIANKYACVGCDFKSSFLSMIKNHIAEKHSIDNHSDFHEDVEDCQGDEESNDNFSCPECDFQCLTKRGIEMHMANAHRYLIKVFNIKTGHVSYRKADQLIEPKPIENNPKPSNEKTSESNVIKINEPKVIKIKPKIDEDHNIKCLYACPDCDFNGTLFEFKMHRRTHMIGRKNTEIQRKTPSSKILDEKFSTVKSSKLQMSTPIEDYSCKMCDVKCDSTLDLRSHMDLTHNSLLRFSCTKCNYKCHTETDLHRHISSHSIKKRHYACSECKISFNEKADLMSHMVSMKHTGGKYFSCPICKAMGFTGKELKVHIESHEPETDPLENCEKHLDGINSDDVNNSDITNSDITNTDDSNNSDDINNSETNGGHDNITGTSIGRRQSSRPRKAIDYHAIEGQSESEDSEVSNEEYVTCSECNYKGTEIGVKIHKKQAHTSDVKKSHKADGNTDLAACSECNYKGTVPGLKIHKQSHRAAEVKKAKSGSEVAKQGYVDCNECNYSGTVLGLIIHKNKMHKASHTEEPQVKKRKSEDSEVSPKVPPKVSPKVSHKVMVACSQCNFKGTLLGLKRHTKTHIEAVKKKRRFDQFRCFFKECDFMSHTYKGIKKHAQEHDASFNAKQTHKNDKFRCSQKGCEFVSSSLKGIDIHARAHTVVKPYTCKKCDFSCFTQKVLDTHIGRKHGNEAYACKICDYIGNSLIGFSRHNSKAHNITVRFDKRSIAKNSPQTNPSKYFGKDKDEDEDEAFVGNGSVNLDSQQEIKLEPDTYGDEIAVKVEAFPVQIEIETKVNSIESSVNLDSEVKQEIDASGDEFESHMDIKEEEDPLQVDLKQEIESCSDLSFSDNSLSILCNFPEISNTNNNFHCQYCDYSTISKYNFETHLKTHINEKTHKSSTNTIHTGEKQGRTVVFNLKGNLMNTPAPELNVQ